MRLGKVRHESKYLTIRHLHAEKIWSIGWMCSHLGISRAAYYKWLHRTVPDAEHENIKPAEWMKEFDERFHHILGYRRMASWINHFNHTAYSKNRVHKIMKKLGIHSVIRKKKKKYTYAKPDETVGNILQRDFYASAPNRLVFETFDRAVAAFPDAKPVFHSDRGFQYTSKMFQKKLEKQDMEQSMSRVGHCIDNGPTEGFWGIIKTEMYQMYKITDEASLRYAIKDYLRFYSEERPQDRYHCKTPLEVRQEALDSDMPIEYPIPENKRINKYKEKWCA